MNQETETVTIVLCNQETDCLDTEIVKGKGWNIELSNEQLGFKGHHFKNN